MRPAETRMGSGKGAPEYWVAVVKPGKVLYELKGVPETVARVALRLAASKLPVKTQYCCTSKVFIELLMSDRDEFSADNKTKNNREAL